MRQCVVWLWLGCVCAGISVFPPILPNLKSIILHKTTCLRHILISNPVGNHAPNCGWYRSTMRSVQWWCTWSVVGQCGHNKSSNFVGPAVQILKTFPPTNLALQTNAQVNSGNKKQYVQSVKVNTIFVNIDSEATDQLSRTFWTCVHKRSRKSYALIRKTCDVHCLSKKHTCLLAFWAEMFYKTR